MKNQNLPPIEVFVWDRFLHNDDPDYKTKTQGHLVSVRARQNQALQFTVLLETGALFTGLPAHAITFTQDCSSPVLSLQSCQMWDCVSDDIDVITMETMRYFNCEVFGNEIAASGMYLFTIDFVGEGYSRNPVHWKQLHAIQSSTGYLLLYPQYRIIFVDKALCPKNSESLNYRANSKHWIVGSK